MSEIRSGTLLAYIDIDMKKMMETLKTVIDEIKKDIGIYLTIQRYARMSRRAKEE